VGDAEYTVQVYAIIGLAGKAASAVELTVSRLFLLRRLERGL
jgi:hypothetical protein